MLIREFFPESAWDLISVRGHDVLRRLGRSVLWGIVADVLKGKNVRDATEPLTRRRISLLNGALLMTYTGLHGSGIRVTDIPDLARTPLMRSKDGDERIVLQWMPGMTGKQFQNVPRSDEEAWSSYLVTLKEGLASSVRMSQQMYGDMPLQLWGTSASWDWAISMLMAIGSQTLSVRGSEKAIYGKLFEKLVLASVLPILGFGYAGDERNRERSFWLSSRGEKRESDATALWTSRQGVRFDIGFIGAGNPEITFDKVTRFEATGSAEGANRFVHTFIIVDRVGKKSRVPELAMEIGGTVVQMSASDWVQTLDRHSAGSAMAIGPRSMGWIKRSTMWQ